MFSEFGLAPWQQAGAILALRSKGLIFRWSLFHVSILYFTLSTSVTAFWLPYVALIYQKNRWVDRGVPLSLFWGPFPPTSHMSRWTDLIKLHVVGRKG